LGVDRDGFAKILRAGSAVVIDTCILIAYLEGGQKITNVAKLLIDDWVYSQRNRGFISVVSAMELFVGPLRGNRAIDDYRDFVQRFPNLTCVPIDITVAEEAAIVRARENIKTPDALIIGTAVAIGAEAIVTNDRRWLTASPKPVIILSQFA
jgi:predicted nucleic acid-binding protein